MTLPDVLVGVRISGLEMLRLDLEDFREPRVVLPVDLRHMGIGRRIDHEAPVGVVCVQIRIEADPDLAIRSADGGDQDLPAALAHRLRFLYPASVDLLEGFDAVPRLAR